MFKRSFKILIIIVSLSFLLSFVLIFGRMILFSKSGENNVNQADVEKNDLIVQNQEAIVDAQNVEKKDIRLIDQNDHIWGDISAPVKMIVYIDFDCPFCEEYRKILKQVQETYPDKVVIALRHLPLISHSNAISAALASECASEQDNFLKMYDALYDDKLENKLNIDEYKKDAEEIGLDVAKFTECFETEKYKNKILQEKVEAEDYGIIGTPATFINGMSIPGAKPFEDYKESNGESREGLKTIIDKLLKQ